MKRIMNNNGVQIGEVLKEPTGATLVKLNQTAQAGLYMTADEHSPFYPPNLPIYAVEKILPKPGDIVLLNPTTNLSVSEYDVQPTTRIGVAVDDSGNGRTDYIRWLKT